MRLFNICSGFFRILQTLFQPDHVEVWLEARRKIARCPSCGWRSRRIHSRYVRKASDLPCVSHPVIVFIHTRKFFCKNRRCPQEIFTERFPSVLASYGRRTERTNRVLLELVNLGNAEHAAMVARFSGHTVSPETLIRMQRLEQFPAAALTALGVDEFAWRKGRDKYGSIMVDLVRHKPVELLPTDAVDEVKAWMQEHPEVEVVARDRDAGFALAAREALPKAIQVADRFHLIQNVHDAFETFVNSKRWLAPIQALPPSTESSSPQEPVESEKSVPRPTPRKQELWESVKTLRAQGHSLRKIGQILHIARATARKYAARSEPVAYPRYARPRHRTWARLEPFIPYLKRRWYEDGVQNIRQLYREVQEQGYQGSAAGFWRLLHLWRDPRPAPPPPPADPWVKVRPLLLFTSVEKWTEEDRTTVEAYLGAHAQLAEAFNFRETFQIAVRKRNIEGLLAWIHDAAQSEFPSFRSLSHGLQRDLEAVRAALVQPWSNGQTEGQNNRLKLIKRLGYGRAKPDLLRVRVLHRVPNIPACMTSCDLDRARKTMNSSVSLRSRAHHPIPKPLPPPRSPIRPTNGIKRRSSECTDRVTNSSSDPPIPHLSFETTSHRFKSPSNPFTKSAGEPFRPDVARL